MIRKERKKKEGGNDFCSNHFISGPLKSCGQHKNLNVYANVYENVKGGQRRDVDWNLKGEGCYASVARFPGLLTYVANFRCHYEVFLKRIASIITHIGMSVEINRENWASTRQECA